jgi:cbb3-type cytochrome oxidase cytochrome c subunit
MKTGVSVFLAALVALGASWFGFVYGSIKQLGVEKQTVILQSSDNWPQQRTGEATLGLQVYRKYGCASCHTEQVRQMGVVNEISLTDLGANKPADFKGLVNTLLENVPDLMASSNVIAGNLESWDGQVPVKLYSGQDSAAVAELSDKLKGLKVKTDARVVAMGSDIWRGWGVRQSVAADYLYDAPVQLGSLRAGPDLSMIGARAPDASWQLQHLYAPQLVVQGSTMPPFKFLFVVRKKADGQTSPDALPVAYSPAQDMEVVPTAEARQLVAYLLSLKANQPLYEAPFTPVTAAK